MQSSQFSRNYIYCFESSICWPCSTSLQHWFSNFIRSINFWFQLNWRKVRHQLFSVKSAEIWKKKVLSYESNIEKLEKSKCSISVEIQRFSFQTRYQIKNQRKKLGQNSLYLIGIDGVIDKADNWPIIRTVTLVVPILITRIERKFE